MSESVCWADFRLKTHNPEGVGVGVTGPHDPKQHPGFKPGLHDYQQCCVATTLPHKQVISTPSVLVRKSFCTASWSSKYNFDFLFL